jgi:hypothetical protein
VVALELNIFNPVLKPIHTILSFLGHPLGMIEDKMDNAGPSLNPYEAPPLEMKAIFKRYQKMKVAEINGDEAVIDFSRSQLPHDVTVLESIKSSRLVHIFDQFYVEDEDNSFSIKDSPVYSQSALPGNNVSAVMSHFQFRAIFYYISLLSNRMVMVLNIFIKCGLIQQ